MKAYQLSLPFPPLKIQNIIKKKKKKEKKKNNPTKRKRYNLSKKGAKLRKIIL